MINPKSYQQAAQNQIEKGEVDSHPDTTHHASLQVQANRSFGDVCKPLNMQETREESQQGVPHV